MLSVCLRESVPKMGNVRGKCLVEITDDAHTHIHRGHTHYMVSDNSRESY